MNLISQQNRADLKRRFRKELKRDVTLKFFTTTTSSTLVLPGRECPTCPQAQELLEVTTALSPKLNLETYDYFSDIDERERCGVERIPAIVMESERGSILKYYGVPARLRIWPPRSGHHHPLQKSQPPHGPYPPRLANGEPSRTHSGLRHTLLTVLPGGGQVGPRNGPGEQAHHRRRRRGSGVPELGSPVQRFIRPPDGYQPDDRVHWRHPRRSIPGEGDAGRLRRP